MGGGESRQKNRLGGGITIYDIIGDIHGHATPLKELLTKLGYCKQNGVWKHPTRKAIFVGDFIDRGPSIREALHIVKDMVDNNSALAVMGNHEFNAIAYSYKLTDGQFLRPHNAKNDDQHKKTLEQFMNHSNEWEAWIGWFYQLPLFLELDGLRVVHACWDDSNIDWLTKINNGKLTEHLLVEAHKKGTTAFDVIEETLKGKEIEIPDKYAWRDKDGHSRNANRIKWWVDSTKAKYGDLLFNCPESLMNEQFPSSHNLSSYHPSAPPVFFGHYWLEGSAPVLQTSNVLCLDYSIANGGSLVAYRWSGENILRGDNFIIIPEKGV